MPLLFYYTPIRSKPVGNSSQTGFLASLASVGEIAKPVEIYQRDVEWV